ncbi:MAG: energy transducer TonB [Candidatus Pseudobacter hemicellulosilyticus]|uniref:Energy transducer TonB n=1 Tax=Candidatus Pseudobacter hemicellulosilyticus TaxID=3121375 RepID=A0AAJ5WRU9_9BACT|nr:MAG: energy transducer TonB [Pseudobacter sp.]
MNTSNILTADVLDIIFDGRNKQYGAYELRRHYSRRLFKSIAVMLSGCLLLGAGFAMASRHNSDKDAVFNISDHQLVDVAPPEQPKELPPPPKPQTPPPPQQVATLKVTPPRIVPDDQVDPNDKPPVVEDIEKVRVGTENIKGVDDIGAPPPMAGDGDGNKVIEQPAKREDDYGGIFLKVEIESTFPGGRQAWERFLNKNLANNYPQDAVDNGIQGTVVIQFIVDSMGLVSNVEAIAGPEELRATAVRVIEKSGKWNPAVQNHRKVKSYKKQPIVFKLSED